MMVCFEGGQKAMYCAYPLDLVGAALESVLSWTSYNYSTGMSWGLLSCADWRLYWETILATPTSNPSEG